MATHRALRDWPDHESSEIALSGYSADGEYTRPRTTVDLNKPLQPTTTLQSSKNQTALQFAIEHFVDQELKATLGTSEWIGNTNSPTRVGKGRCYGLVRLPDTQQPDR
jgi:hypothetical protein